MIHQNRIKRRADEDGLSAPAVERDYVLAHSLAAISSMIVRNGLPARVKLRCGFATSRTIATRPTWTSA